MIDMAKDYALNFLGMVKFPALTLEYAQKMGIARETGVEIVQGGQNRPSVSVLDGFKAHPSARPSRFSPSIRKSFSRSFKDK